MRAVLPEAGPSGSPRLGELPDPKPGPGEVLIGVRATALNRADLLQLLGQYPPPPSESLVPGLECSGVVERLGSGVVGIQVGARVMALLAGGGHAERVAVPAGQVLALPDPLSFIDGAALPEACLTAWTNVVAEGDLQPGQTVVVTGATGGMGTMAVQLAHELGARVIAVARDRQRLAGLAELGAHERVLLADGWAQEVSRLTGGEGADLVFELVGGPVLADSLSALRIGGCLVQIGLMAGRSATLDLSLLMRRRLRLIGSVLRPRSRAEKAALVRGFGERCLPALAAGRLRAIVDRVLPFERIAEAYAAFAAGNVGGKIVLTLD